MGTLSNFWQWFIGAQRKSLSRLDDDTSSSVILAASTAASPNLTHNEYGYLEHPRARRCVDIIAQAVASVPYEAKPQQLAGLLEYVNERQDYYQLIRGTISAMLLFGTAYWEIARNKNDAPAALYLLSQPGVTITPVLQNGEITKYKVRQGSKKVQYLPAEDVVSIALYSPNSPSGIFGEPLINTVATTIEADWALMAFVKGYFSSGIPAGVLSVQGANKDIIKDLAKNWSSKYKNDKLHRLAIVNAPLDYQKLSDDLKSSLYIELHDRLNADIAEAFGVPESLLRADAANYATARQDFINFQQLTVAPLVRQLEAALNAQLAPQFLQGSVEFQVQVQKAQEPAMLQQAVAAYEYGLLSADEARAFFGLEAQKTTPVPRKSLVQKAVSRKEQVYNDTERRRRKYETEMLAVVAAIYAKYGAEAAKSAARLTPTQAMKLYDVDAMAGELHGAVMEKARAIVDAEAGEAAASPEADAEFAKYKAYKLNQHVQAAQNWQEQLQRHVSEQVAAGVVGVGLAKALADYVNEHAKSRARVVAETESVSAQGLGSYLRASGERVWISMRDGKVRPAHVEADGQVAKAGEPFIVGGEPLMYPGDPAGSPGNIINCRCVAVPREEVE